MSRPLLKRISLRRKLVVLAALLAVPVAHQLIPHQSLHHALGIGGEDVAEAHASEHLSSSSIDPSVYRRAGGRSDCPRRLPPMIHDSFPEPQYLFSQDGLLDVDLTASRGPTEIDGQTYVTSSYNGQFPGPTLVACPGDTVNVHVRNDLVPGDYAGMHAGETNLHTHGLHVSPHVPSDNVFRTIVPGDDFQYQYEIPLDHPPGAYWYHPHLHGQTDNQVFGGMAGAIIIEGGIDSVPAYRDIPTRDLVIQETKLGDGVTLPPAGPFGQIFVNGASNPEIPIKPGELQRWRIYNAGADQFLKLQLTGGSFSLLARDGNYVVRRQRQQVMTIAPGSRREVLVRGGSAGTYELVSLPFQQTPTAQSPQQTIATVISGGSAPKQTRPPKLVADLDDLRGESVARRHKLVYTQSPPEFFINGKQFDPDVVNETMRLNQVEQWKVVNHTPFWHTFHIHVNDFQVTKVNGQPVRGINTQDNVSVGPNGTVTMRTLPTDFTGKFVFHCHVLGHEDGGMMAVVRVTD